MMLILNRMENLAINSRIESTDTHNASIRSLTDLNAINGAVKNTYAQIFRVARARNVEQVGSSIKVGHHKLLFCQMVPILRPHHGPTEFTEIIPRTLSVSIKCAQQRQATAQAKERVRCTLWRTNGGEIA
jgi:hypothetical protein